MKKILLMEDYPAHAMEMIQQLEMLDYEATWARNATEAIDFLAKEEFDAVVADILVRDGVALTANGGVTLIGKVRSSAIRITTGKVTRRLPIIAISGAFERNGKPNFLSDTALGVGADAIMPKPVNVKELSEMVEKLTSEPGPEA